MELRDLIIDGVNGYDLVQTESKNPVWNPPYNNWSVNQPSGPHQTGLSAYQDLGQNMIVDGHRVHFAQVSEPNSFAQTNSKNPVWNPPFNNWSVNQPSPPHATGLNAYEDLGQNIIVDGHKVHFGQQSEPSK